MFSGPPGKPEKKINPLEKAMRLLSVRSYSERELMKKLRLAKIPAREAAEAIAECRRRGYLNDELLAEDYAHALVNRGSGSRLVKLQLRKRGIGGQGHKIPSVRTSSSIVRTLSADATKP